MPKYIIQGYVRNGAYRRVGLAIEKGSIEEVKAALAEVDDSTGAYGKTNLNHVELNQDGQERSIIEVAVEAFLELELKDKKRKDFISILEELIASDKIDKGHPSIIIALNKALLSTRENSTFNQSIKAILNKLKETNTEFQYNLYKSEHFLTILQEIKHKVDGKKFKEIVQINALGALDNEHSIAFLILVKNGILTKSLVSDALANKILESYKARDLFLFLEELRSLVGDKLSPDYIRARLSEAIKTSAEEKIQNLLRYCNDHKEEFSNQPLVSHRDLELSFKENEGIFISLLNKENSISADSLKNFLSQSIRNSNPKTAMLLVAYYLRNESSLKSEIGVNLLSKDDLYKVFEKRHEQNWKELGAIIQSSGAIEIDKQYLEGAGWGVGVRKTGIAPFIMTLTPASLKLALDNNDLSIANLSAEDIELLAKKIASSPDLEFKQYIEILFSKEPPNYPVLLNKIVEASYGNGFTLEILIDKNLVSSLLPQAALNLYKRGNIHCLEKLADRNLIALAEVDENGNTLLHHALANKHYDLAHKIIDSAGNDKIKGRALIQATNKDGFTPLLYLLRQQPYSKSKSLVMGSIMMRNSFEYSREQIGERIDHILLAIPDIETAKDFLVYLEQATKTPEAFTAIAQNIFNKAVLDNNQIMVEAILGQCKGKFNIDSLTYFNHNGSERTEAPIFVAYANATTSNNYAIVHLLLKNKNLDINKCGGTQDVTLLHQAAIDGNHDLVLKILEREPKEKLSPDTGGYQHMLLNIIGTAHSLGTKVTLEAAELKKLDGLRAVFNSITNDSRVNVNCTDDKGDTPALLIYRNLQATKIKIKQLQELGEQKPQNISSLATDLRDKATKLFVNSNAELKNLQEYEKSLTNQLSSLIHNDKVDVLIENNQKESLASLSIINNDVDTLQLIVTRAIAENNKFELWHTFNQSDKNGNTPLMHAYASGNKEMLELVRIAAGSESQNPEALYQKQNKDKQNILIAACKGGNKEMVVDAFSHLKNKDLSKSDILGNTPLHHATSKPDILKFLLDQDESKKALNAQNSEGQTLLIKAVLEGNVKAIQLLLAKGANVNSTDKHGNTPLMYACILDRVDIINELLNRPEVDVRAVSNIGATAYMYAALRGSIDEAQGKGSNQNKDWDGNPEVITALISRGADPLFGTYYQSITEKMTGILTEALTSNLLGSVTSRILGSDSIVSQGLQATAAIKVASDTYKSVSSSVQLNLDNFLLGGQGAKINLADRCMIGAMSLESFGRVTWGDSLKALFEGKKQFNGHAKAIYTLAELKERKQEIIGRNKDVEFHESLQARYVRIQTDLDNRLVPFWTRGSLNKIQKEILEADILISERLLNKNLTNITTELKATFAVLESKNRDRFIVDMLTSTNKEKFTDFKNLLEEIRKKEIFVPADVMYNLIQFEKRYEKLAQQQKNPSLFRRIVGFKFGRKPIDATVDKALKNIKAKNSFKTKTTTAAITTPKQNKKETHYETGTAINIIGHLTNQQPQDVAKGIAEVCGKAAGIGAGAVTFATMDFDHTYKIYLLSSMALGATNILGSGVLEVGRALSNLMPEINKKTVAAAGVAAVGVGLYYAYTYLTSPSSEQANQAIFTPKSLEDLSNPSCPPEAAKAFMAENAATLELNAEAKEKSQSIAEPSIRKESQNTQTTPLPKTRYEYVQQVLASTSVAAYIEPAKPIITTENVVQSITQRQNLSSSTEAKSKGYEGG